MIAQKKSRSQTLNIEKKKDVNNRFFMVKQLFQNGCCCSQDLGLFRTYQPISITFVVDVYKKKSRNSHRMVSIKFGPVMRTLHSMPKLKISPLILVTFNMKVQKTRWNQTIKIYTNYERPLSVYREFSGTTDYNYVKRGSLILM